MLANHLLGREEAKSLLRAVRFVHHGSTASDQTFQALATAYTTISFALGTLAGLDRALRESAMRFHDGPAYVARVLDGVASVVPSAEPSAGDGSSLLRALLVIALSCATALAALFRERIPAGVRKLAEASLARALSRLRDLQSGLVGDYVTWLVLGVACFGALSALLLR